MSLEQFKTQVLLLHSQRHALNRLGAEFGEQYAMHYATSGTEALNTLSERPIEVFISAQDLPGMNGLAVLREARKLSPATVGILMVSVDQDDLLETLSDDDDLFQIVHGEISGDTLSDLIESATKRVNFLTTAESAIATAADDSTGEHIILETSEYGVAVVSSDFRQEPGLKPESFVVSPAAGGKDVAILVLTKDDDLLTAIHTAVDDLHNVHHASTHKQAGEFVRNCEIGVFIIDTATISGNIDTVLKKLRATKSNIVPIIAGQRNDGEMLMDYVNRGRIYRFLLEPVSAGRARLAIESSVRYHLDSSQKSEAIAPHKAPPNSPENTLSEIENVVSNDASFVAKQDISVNTDQDILVRNPGSVDRKSPPNRAAIYAIAGATIVGAAITLWLLMGRNAETGMQSIEQDTAASMMNTKDAQAEPLVPTAVIEAMETARSLLAIAREARDAGRLVSDSDDNAVLLYRAAVAAPYQDDIATTELLEIVDEVIVIAETALLEMRLQEAATALELVAIASPNNARLTFLIAQMAQVKYRAMLDRTRVAVREQRFGDAEELLTIIRTLKEADSEDLDALNGILAAGQRQHKVDSLLTEADQHLNAGSLISPANRNAHYFYQLALDNDPGNAVARQGLMLVINKLALQVRYSIDTDSLIEAEILINEIRNIDPEYSELASLVTELDTAIESRRAEAEREAKAVRLARETRREELRREAVGSIITDPENAEPIVNEFQVADKLSSQKNTEVSFNESGTSELSTLKRTHYVAPTYPSRAARGNITGWVDLSFMVGITGEVTHIEVIDTEPPKTFSGAAVRAAEQWRFEPETLDGRPVEKRVTIRMVFSLEN